MVVRRTIVFSDESVKLVEGWRKKQQKIPSFNEAVNKIIKEVKIE